MLRVLLPTLLIGAVACGSAPPPESHQRPPAAVPWSEPEPDPEAEPEPVPPPDPVEGLRLELPGVPRDQLVERVPECAEALDEEGTSETCTFEGPLTELPLQAHCGGGCTTWTYVLEDGVIASTELVRRIGDVDAWFYRAFMREADTMAEHMVERFGEGEHEELGGWSEVRRGERGTPTPIERRRWTEGDLVIDWEVKGMRAPRALTVTITAQRGGADAGGVDEASDDDSGDEGAEQSETEPDEDGPDA